MWSPEQIGGAAMGGLATIYGVVRGIKYLTNKPATPSPNGLTAIKIEMAEVRVQVKAIVTTQHDMGLKLDAISKDFNHLSGAVETWMAKNGGN